MWMMALMSLGLLATPPALRAPAEKPKPKVERHHAHKHRGRRHRPKPTSLVGSWIITTKPKHDFCGYAAQVHPSTYQWLVSGNPEAVNITVIGETSFPKLAGHYKHGSFVASGYNTVHKSTSYFTLRYTQDSLKGMRYFTINARNGYPCLVIYEVHGTRQQ